MSNTKSYTAKEMRYAADLREAWGDKDEVNEMLRYAAEVLERCDWLRWLLRNSRVTVYTKCGPVAFKDVRLGADGHEVIIDTEGSCPRLMECDRDTLHKCFAKRASRCATPVRRARGRARTTATGASTRPANASFRSGASRPA